MQIESIGSWAIKQGLGEDTIVGQVGGIAYDVVPGFLIGDPTSGRMIWVRFTPGKFNGQPFAYGMGARSARAQAIMEEAAKVVGVELSSLVDDVRYSTAGSYFTVDWANRRIVYLGPNAFKRNAVGQLTEGVHELTHAQVFDKMVQKWGFTTALDECFTEYRVIGQPLSTALYAKEERLVERLARWRVRRYLGSLTPQQEAASTRYIDGYYRSYLFGERPHTVHGTRLKIFVIYGPKP